MRGIIFRKWETVVSCLGPNPDKAYVEEMRRVFYAGATATFEAIVKETENLSTAAHVSVIDSVASELVEHRNALVAQVKRKIN
jgi:hypothetical protein